MYKQPPSQKISTEWVERSASVNLIQFSLSCPDLILDSLQSIAARGRRKIEIWLGADFLLKIAGMGFLRRIQIAKYLFNLSN